MMQTHYSLQIKTLYSCPELENSFLSKGQEKQAALEFDYKASCQSLAVTEAGRHFKAGNQLLLV